jgi:PKD repeat protein
MKHLPVVVSAMLLISGSMLHAQDAVPERQADFHVEAAGESMRFVPDMPPLVQKAGAPNAYYACFWEFGDGSFSRDDNPVHTYPRAGEYTVSLDATAHYDDGKKPRKKKRPAAVMEYSEALAALEMPDVFDAKKKQAIAMAANSQPRAGEEMTCIISYRNNAAVTTDGRLHVFFNERKFPVSHFTFTGARTHFGETEDPLYSDAMPFAKRAFPDWATLDSRQTTGAHTAATGEPPPFSILQDILNNARGAYREERAWRFTELKPGEKRNLFLSLAGTANMIRDTSAFIHLDLVFAPFDPALPPERFTLELEIVSSHDPNAIAVSDNRINYRTLGDKKLDYKVQFQNNGEGPAGTVDLQIEIPEGLNMTRMRPLDWYPQCPICPPAPTDRSCLDTASSPTGLRFTFRNIYLPGSNQEGVDNRDSTKGFVKYRIEAEKDMPKRSFRSRAAIIFDKNPPIHTNFTKTRFKTGISPGIKAGYNLVPDSSQGGYIFLGASISPYKSWRVYPQLELLMGLKGQQELPQQIFRDSVISGNADFKVVTETDSIIDATKGFVSIGIPVLLRKNFTRYFGAGIGGSARIFFENGNTTTRVRVRERFVPLPGTPPIPPQVLQDTSYTAGTSATVARYTFFGDLTFGAVRTGPNLGIRAGAVLGRKQKLQPFVQVSLELKL